MRGHLGFRLPRADFLDARITQFVADNLTYTNNTQPVAVLTQFIADQLQFLIAQNEPRISQMTVGVLTYTAAREEPRITRLTLDALTYTP